MLYLLRKLSSGSGILMILVFFILNYSCLKENNGIPIVTTAKMNDVSLTSAAGGGNVSYDGGEPVISKGVCWKDSSDPTIDDSKSEDGPGTGPYSSKITGLIPYKEYFLRAYAINKIGTAYGNQITFVTDGIITDIDGNNYNTVIIGTQTWMKENLKTTSYSSGDKIPYVTSRLEWFYLTSAGYCWYDDDIKNKNTYGALYNWYALNPESNGNKNVCPGGWHVPTDIDWSYLITYLGGESNAVAKLKETGNINWLYPNTDATNETGFSALPAGGRDYDGVYFDLGTFGYWWSSTEFVSGGAWSRFMGYDGSGGFRYGRYEQDGFSVRCIKNEQLTK
jgi:uncharacterized protein (TIGR02145 family)